MFRTGIILRSVIQTRNLIAKPQYRSLITKSTVYVPTTRRQSFWAIRSYSQGSNDLIFKVYEFKDVYAFYCIICLFTVVFRD